MWVIDAVCVVINIGVRDIGTLLENCLPLKVFRHLARIKFRNNGLISNTLRTEPKQRNLLVSIHTTLAGNEVYLFFGIDITYASQSFNPEYEYLQTLNSPASLKTTPETQQK